MLKRYIHEKGHKHSIRLSEIPKVLSDFLRLNASIKEVSNKTLRLTISDNYNTIRKLYLTQILSSVCIIRHWREVCQSSVFHLESS